MIGKAEGKGREWHGHVTAVTVAPQYRRLGLARILMKFLEEVSDKTYAPASPSPPISIPISIPISHLHPYPYPYPPSLSPPLSSPPSSSPSPSPPAHLHPHPHLHLHLHFRLHIRLCFALLSHAGYFVDLYVRASNSIAINMYKGFGYVIYRRVIGYYAGEEDAFGKTS